MVVGELRVDIEPQMRVPNEELDRARTMGEEGVDRAGSQWVVAWSRM